MTQIFDRAVRLARRIYPRLPAQPQHPNQRMSNADWAAAVIAQGEWQRLARRRELIESLGLLLIGLIVAGALIAAAVARVYAQLPQ